MDIVGQEKPSLEELSLQHFGVRGMKWGVRKGVGPQIRLARRNVSLAKGDLREQRKVIRKTDRGSEVRTREKKKYADMKVAFLNNPDRATAVRMTRGEKAAVLLLNAANPIGFVGATAAVTAASIQSRVIARRQKTGAYNR